MANWNTDLTDYKIVKYPTATAYGTMASGTSANTYTGTYQQVIAASGIATSFYLVGVFLVQSDASPTQTEIKVGVGTAGSESDIYEETKSAALSIETGNSFFDPIKIAANSRVAVDVNDSEAAANNIYYALYFKVPQ